MSDQTNVYACLSAIRAEIVAPKGQRNSFGKYNYRSVEDINEALKPLCDKYGCGYYCTDEMIVIPINEATEVIDRKAETTTDESHDARIYVKATAVFYMNDDPSEKITATACARESLTKKGMDDSQVTGSCSSYARKYALCGLFAIDGGDDPDAADNTGRGTARATRSKKARKSAPVASEAYAPATADDINELGDLMDKFGAMTGKTSAEVHNALVKSKTMTEMNYTGQNPSKAQIQTAVKIVNVWIEKTAKNVKE